MSPALFRTKVRDKQGIIKPHSGCDNDRLGFSRFGIVRGHGYMVYVCDKCGYGEERGLE